MKNILYVSPNGFLGGAEKVLLETMSAHTLSGRDRVKILFFNPGKFSDLAAEKHFNPTILPFRFRLSHLPSLLRALFFIRRFVKAEKIDIIHSTMAYTHIVMCLATLGLGMKHVWFQHGPVSSTLDKIAAFFPADIILFNSQYLREEHFKANSNFYHTASAIIPLGVKSFRFKEKATGPLKILLAGRLAPIKGFHLVLEAAENLLKENPELGNQVKIDLIGASHGAKEEAYLKILQGKISKLAGVARLLPFNPDMDAVYPDYDLLIQPSLIGEGFGLVLAEAMGHSLLVAGPSYGGSQEILKDGVTGLCFDFKSPRVVDELSEFMRAVILDYKRYEIIRKDALAMITERHSTKTMMNEFFRVYGSL